MARPGKDFKKKAHELIDWLPDGATWDDVLYHFDVVRSIEAGLKDVQAGRVFTTDEIRRHFGQIE